MRLLPKSLKWRGILYGLALGAVMVCLFFGSTTGRRVFAWMLRGMPTGDAYYVDQLRDSTDPFHRDLARGHIKAGDSFDEIVSKYPVQGITHHGEYCTAVYPGLCISGGSRVMAKNGRLVFADQELGGHPYTYFNTLPPAELDAALTSWIAVSEAKRRQWVASSAAVMGVAPLARRAGAEDFPTPE